MLQPHFGIVVESSSGVGWKTRPEPCLDWDKWTPAKPKEVTLDFFLWLDCFSDIVLDLSRSVETSVKRREETPRSSLWLYCLEAWSGLTLTVTWGSSLITSKRTWMLKKKKNKKKLVPKCFWSSSGKHVLAFIMNDISDSVIHPETFLSGVI